MGCSRTRTAGSAWRRPRARAPATSPAVSEPLNLSGARTTSGPSPSPSSPRTPVTLGAWSGLRADGAAGHGHREPLLGVVEIDGEQLLDAGHPAGDGVAVHAQHRG